MPLLTIKTCTALPPSHSACRPWSPAQVYDPLPGDSASFSRIIREGLAKWAAVVKDREIKVEQ